MNCNHSKLLFSISLVNSEVSCMENNHANCKDIFMNKSVVCHIYTYLLYMNNNRAYYSIIIEFKIKPYKNI